MNLLEIRGLRTGFGSQTVLHGVDLDAPAAQVTGVFGLNGAGKSVLLKTVAGVVPAWSGTVTMDGVAIEKLTPERRVELGMAHIPQGRQVFKSLTVEQNLRVGGHVLRKRDRGGYADELEKVYAMFPRLAERRRQAAGTLSGGEQAMLAVGRVLVARPRLVLVDEPSAGLAPLVVDQLLESLLAIRAQGMTMLLVEQNIRFGLRLADRAFLLQRGSVVYGGDAASLDPERMAGYLGVGQLLSSDLRRGLSRPAGRRRAKGGAAAPAATEG